MAGTGDSEIQKAKDALKAANQRFEDAGRSQASPGHSQRLSDARKDAEAAKQTLVNTERRWGGR